MKKTFCILLLSIISIGCVFAQKNAKTEYNLLIRPNSNIGYLKNDWVASYGMRVLLPAGENQAYGLEFSRFQSLNKGISFYTAGIILEQKQFNWFNMSIGTIGYFSFDEDKKNYAGLVTNLGWEPITNSRFGPFFTWRSDFIFTNNIQIMNSLNIGLNIKI